MVNSEINKSQQMIDICWYLTLTLAVCVIVGLMPDMVMAQTTGGTGGVGAAQGNNAITQVFCNVVLIMTGTTGKAVATVAVIAVGVGALLGKISWAMVLIITLGVGLIFGAATIVDALGGSGQCTGTAQTIGGNNGC